MGGKLPINPWLFIVLMLALTAIGAVGIGANMWLTAGVDTLCLALQTAWIFQAGKFSLASQNSEISEKRAKPKRLMTGALIFLAISWPGTLLFFSFFADPDSGTVTGTPAAAFMPSVFLLLAALFTLIFQAPRPCARRKARTPASGYS
jgi:hypothetical protein